MFYLTAQYKLCILKRLIVEHPVQLCPLCRGIAVFVLDGGAVDGNGRAVCKPGFHPVSVHVVAAGKQFGILQKLMHRPDVESVICATDAG